MKKIILVIIVLFISFFTIAQDANSEEFDDLVSVFYTALNKGWDEFTFYCDYEYK